MSTENNKPNEMLSFLIMIFQWRFHTFFNGSQTQLMLAHVYEYCSKLNKQSRFVLFRNIARVSHAKLAYGHARHDFPVISISPERLTGNRKSEVRILIQGLTEMFSAFVPPSWQMTISRDPGMRWSLLIEKKENVINN